MKLEPKIKKNFDIVVVGASLGGVAAALSAAKAGRHIALIEKTASIGGQLTNQAVPPDEHQYIETTGCTNSYREFRNSIRDYYRNHPYIIDELKTKDYFCPGGSSVSRIAHEPKLALKLLNQMLEPFVKKGLLQIFTQTELVAAKADGVFVGSVTAKTLENQIEFVAPFFLDATDTGELIKISGCEYTCGAESKAQTGEPNAADKADRFDMQPVTWVGAVEYDPNEDVFMPKPAEYEFFKKLKQPYDCYPVLSWYGPDSSSGKAKRFAMFANEYYNGQKLFPLFTYRRIIAAHHFKDGYVKNDVSLINWPQNDYFLDNLFDSADDAHNAYMARQLTLSLIYWLKTEAERPDGKKGYGGINLRTDILGTTDALAQAPYIRESRRIKSDFLLTEQMISKRTQTEQPHFFDSAGIGSYHIDLHITTRSHRFFYDNAWRFQIPLRAFVPVKFKNLLPACKNIAVTSITNGCYRLHPVEWNIGEAAGFLADYCLKNRVEPKEAVYDRQRLADFQKILVQNGIKLEWD